MIAAAAVPDHAPSRVPDGGAQSGRGTSVATLDGVWRFTHPWERDATLRLRTGDPTAVDEYARHGRLVEGDADQMLDAAYAAWQADETAGRTSLLVAADNTTVDALNTRARADRVAAGTVSADGVRVGGTVIGVGDRVVTRRNTRDVQVLKGTDVVRNGDTWTVQATGPDGSLRVKITRHHGVATLPADYVAQFVELGYASTAHRAQGATVDTAHLILTPALVRETAYVGMTRGRTANTAYVVTGDPLGGPETHQPSWAAGQPVTGAEVWAQVLATEGAELAAHTVLADALHAEESLATLVPRYEFAAQTWHALGWPALVDEQLLGRGITPALYPDLDDAPPPAGTVHAGSSWSASPALVPLAATLTAASRSGMDPERLFRLAVASGRLLPADGVRDPVAILQARVERAVTASTEPRLAQGPRGHATWVAGLTPRMPTAAVSTPEVAELAAYLEDLADAIEIRATDVGLDAIMEGATWLPTASPDLAALTPVERADQIASHPETLSLSGRAWWAAVRHTAARRDADPDGTRGYAGSAGHESDAEMLRYGRELVGRELADRVVHPAVRPAAPTQGPAWAAPVMPERAGYEL